MKGPGSIERVRKNVWYLRVDLPAGAAGARRRHRETFHGTGEDAKIRLTALLSQVQVDGGAGVDARTTIAEMCERWLTAKKARVGARTYHRYSQIVQDFIMPALGTHRVSKIRPAHVEAALTTWIGGAGKGRKRADGTTMPLSPRSVRHIFDTLRAACRWGVRMEILARNPLAAVDSPTWQQREMRTLDAAGVAELITAARGTELGLPIAVLIGTGMRRGELLGLRWSDVDLEVGRVAVRRSIEVIDGERREKSPKTRRSSRIFAVGPFVVAALLQQRREQLERRLAFGLGRDDNAYVFDRADASPWMPDSFSWSFADLVRRKKLKKVRLHDLRHSYATISLAVGTDLKTISASLGHSTIAVTANTYLHEVESLQQAHAARIDAALGSAVTDALAVVNGPSELPGPHPAQSPPLEAKKPRGCRVSLVAPTGFEPVLPP